MPPTLEVFDRWRSSTPSLSSPILFELCSNASVAASPQPNDGSGADSKGSALTATATSFVKGKGKGGFSLRHIDSIISMSSTKGSGGWQGGNYQNLMERIDSPSSSNSSLQAWSESGHRDHIDHKMRLRRQTSNGQQQRRSSSIINGLLISRPASPSLSEKHHHSLPQLHRPPPFLLLSTLSAHGGMIKSIPEVKTPQIIESPRQMSESGSVSFSSPLQHFPAIPVRQSTGQLIVPSPVLSLPPQTGTPTTPRAFLLPSTDAYRSGKLTIRNPSPLQRQFSQSRVDDSPLDRISLSTGGWSLANYTSERTAGLIDDLLQGVQSGRIEETTIVQSPRSKVESAKSLEDDDWETEDGDMTPRLRPKWLEDDCVSEKTPTASTFQPIQVAQVRRPLSFIRVPSTVFPHTPAATAASTVVRRPPKGSNRQSQLYRQSSSSSSSLARSSSTRRHSLQHAVELPRVTVRKSKYYSRPPQPGIMPSIKMQHLSGARGRFWSPMNRKTVPDRQPVSHSEEVPEYQAKQPALPPRMSTRYSRRSGQAWVAPRTFEGNQRRVTIYPPQVDTWHLQRPQLDAITTHQKLGPITSAYRLHHAEKRRSNRRLSKVSDPPLPAPSSALPPIPKHAGRPPYSARRKSVSASSQGRTSQSTYSCSVCSPSVTCSCSCSGTQTESTCYSFSNRHHSRTESFCESDYQTGRIYTHSDADTCTCTNSRSSMTQSEIASVSTLPYRQRRTQQTQNDETSTQPHSAPLYGMAAQDFRYEGPQSAPYYSSQHPPVLPLPRLSPFFIDFSHVFGGRRRMSRQLESRNSVALTETTSCSCCTGTTDTMTRCSLCFASDSSSTVFATRTTCGTATENTSPSYDSDSKSSSSSSSPQCSVCSSDQDSEPPLTPPRSEYSSSFGFLESPGYRVSLIVSPNPRSAKRYSKMDDLLERTSPSAFDENAERVLSLMAPSTVSQWTSSSQTAPSTITTTTSSTSSSGLTFSVNGTSQIPRSILKTSARYHIDKESDQSKTRRPGVTMSMAPSMLYYDQQLTQKDASRLATRAFSTYTDNSKNGSSNSLITNESSSKDTFGVKKSPVIHRATLATSTMTKQDLDNRIAREENRRKRNESRLYALEKLEGKTKKSNLFLSLLSTSSSSSSVNSSRNDVPSSTTTHGVGSKGIKVVREEWEEGDSTSPSPLTPLTPVKEDLLALQRQFEKRQQVTEFANDKAVQFTDVSGFDMGFCSRLPARKKKTADSVSTADDSDHSGQTDDVLKGQLRKLGTVIEARQVAKDKCIDK